MEALRTRIGDLLSSNGDFREIVRLNSVLFGGRFGASANRTVVATEDDGPWPLCETEEEWFAWEEEWRARRGAQQPKDVKGKQRESISLKAQLSLSSREKVANWQASLQKVASMDSDGISGVNTSSNQPQHSLGQSVGAGNALGFPVVKRTVVLKETKSKPRTTSSQATDSMSSRKAVAAELLNPAVNVLKVMNSKG